MGLKSNSCDDVCYNVFCPCCVEKERLYCCRCCGRSDDPGPGKGQGHKPLDKERSTKVLVQQYSDQLDDDAYHHKLTLQQTTSKSTMDEDAWPAQDKMP